jgi:hypothetical protein
VTQWVTLYDVSESAPSVQRSFRLSRATSDLLDATAASTSESRNSLAGRLLAEALRTERHPLVRFRTGAAGRREPFVVGTRLLVRQIVASARGHEGNLVEAAEYLGVPTRVAQAGVSYYADFADEVDADAGWASATETEERRRWEREQTALA